MFAPLADERFPPIRAGLSAAGREPRDRDAFLLTREAAELVRDLRPDDGLGEGIYQLAALVHHAFLFWDGGQELLAVGRGTLDALMAAEPSGTALPTVPAPYVQVPERLIWARPVEGEAFEPLDGWFAHVAPDGALRALAVFGLHPDRMGFTVVEAAGARPVGLARPDGSPLFAPTVAGGDAAGLRSIFGGEELLELAWRVRDAGESH